jgi:hypothetical protein
LLIGYLRVGGELVIDALLVDLLQAGLSDGLLELERRISSAAALTGLDVTLNAGHGGLGVLDLRPMLHPAIPGRSGDRLGIQPLGRLTLSILQGRLGLNRLGGSLVELVNYRLGIGDFP